MQVAHYILQATHTAVPLSNVPSIQSHEFALKILKLFELQVKQPS